MKEDINIELLCNKYIKYGSKKPFVNYMKEKTKLSVNEIKVKVQRLIDQKKYSYDKKSQRLIPRVKEIEPIEEDNLKKEPFELKSLVSKILKYLLLFVFVTCITISIKYSYDWRAKETSFFWALLSSVSLIVFGVIIPAVTKELKISKTVKLASRCMGCLVLLFSMVQTLGGQYSGYTSKQNTPAITENESIGDSILMAKEDRERIVRMIDVNLESKRVFVNVDDLKMFHTAREKLDKESERLLEELNANTAYINELKENSKSLKKENAADISDDFYTWIAKRLGMKTETIKLILLSFPSIILDVVGPLSLYLFLSSGKGTKD